MLDLLFSNPILFLIWAIALVVGITIHEFAHAWAADKLGDPTPRALGRLTLNPLAHLDPIGSIAILIAHIGWGKPVPFDPYNLENPKRDSMLIALAGPVSNIILAIILSLIIKFSGLSIIQLLLIPIITLNIGLAIFNLLPIPPLDGSKILAGILPVNKSVEWEQFSNRYGIFLLIIFLMPIGGRSLVSTIIYPIIDFVLSILI